MILIITHKEDYTADYLINSLNKRKLNYFRFNCEDIDEYDVYFSNKNDFRPVVNGIDTFKAVWYRRTKYPSFPQYNIPEQQYLIREYEYLLSNFLENLSCSKWLSSPQMINAAENKITQLRAAIKAGFTIPKTLISSNPARLKKFASEGNNKRVIIKPLHSGRLNSSKGVKLIYSNLLKAEQLDNLHLFQLTPCIYQEYIDKVYELRITVVDKRVFAARVNSQADIDTTIDWRKKRLTFQPYILPNDIAEKCIKIVNVLGLKFGAIDMIKTEEGYVFLEVNPNGQWAWIEMDTQLPISNAIIDYLYE